MKKYIYYAILASALSIGTSACHDKLEIEPQLSLSDKDALGTIEDIRTAVLGMYDGMQSVNYYGRDYIVIPEVASDNMVVAIRNSNRYLAFRDFNFTVNNGNLESFWNVAYSVIARANNIIAAMENVQGGSEAERNQLLGEAYAVRALAHFDLVRLFAQPYFNENGAKLGVPIVLRTEIGTPPRATVAEVYTQVIQDLTTAQGLLSTDAGLIPQRMTKAAAAGLLSRVYLYQGNNAKVVEAANDPSLNRFSLISQSNYVQSFSTYGSSEAIFQLAFEADENRGSDNLGNIFLPTGYGDVRPTDEIINLYPTGDVRKGVIRTATKGTETDQFAYKYPGLAGVPGLGAPIILRLSEVILNRAEANAKLGNTAAAIQDLNRIRTRAGLPAITPPPGELLEEILIQRRLELAFEGHRYFDIFRLGRNLVRLGDDCPGKTNCNIPFGSNLIAFPIPQREIEVNPNIVQNPGF
ncbi:RagB/SusD family nutrient uptake outer membrane protein [Pontibacter cellulosilyticus]|uniref:RagB/SusD family nutrient uptake outer membrane protein n=1 Tax=Pontibacter cellulosilyticus TaxID=1720253 RepID=A0A923N7H4_9BACT|nr:RagB/SusD family nutrient uptake outer membrane protein [Pontibacter cellulosilyticus]MBC5993636.1 RagB/SusD family nutrient uptake outer membrane protein [Pontibacter cellulosilyticus]